MRGVNFEVLEAHIRPSLYASPPADADVTLSYCSNACLSATTFSTMMILDQASEAYCKPAPKYMLPSIRIALVLLSLHNITLTKTLYREHIGESNCGLAEEFHLIESSC